MKIEKPSYYLKLNMSKCPRILAINGIEIERDLKGNSNHSEYPINHYIKNGTNRIEMLVGGESAMLKRTDKTSSCKMEVRVRGYIDEKDVDYKVTDIVYTPNYTGNRNDLHDQSMEAGKYSFVKNNETSLVDSNHDFYVSKITTGPLYFKGIGDNFARDFDAVVPFQEWMFFKGETLQTLPAKDNKEYENFEKTIWPLVEDMWDLFDSKDIDAILSHFKIRSSEMDQAFYKKVGTTQKELRSSIENVYSKNYPLDRRDRDYMQLVVSYDGKLATIVNAGTRAGTVLYLDDETDSLTFYTIYWMKKDGKWMIAR